VSPRCERLIVPRMEFFLIEKLLLPLSSTHFLVRFRRVPVPAEHLLKSICFSFLPFVRSYVMSPEPPNGLSSDTCSEPTLFSRNEGVVIRFDSSVFLLRCLHYIFRTYAGIGLFRWKHEMHKFYRGKRKGSKAFRRTGR
jgi:hypothetical protein